MHVMTSGKEETGIAITGSTTNTSEVRPPGALTNAGWNVFSTIWGFAMSFVIASLLIHTIGAAQYGILLLVWSVTGILGVMNFGFGEATLRYAAYHYGEGNISGVNRVMGSTLLFYLVICTIVFVVFFAAAPLLVTFFSIPASDHGLVAWLLRLSALLFSLNLISGVYGNIPLALQRYDIGTKIAVLQSVMRSGGYILLVVFKFGLLPLILWDVVVQIGTLCVQAAVIRRISPGAKLMPALSFRGLRETLGFSIFSFLGYAFYVMKRESAKIILGAQLGPSPIAYLGTPENVALRLYLVVASGSESLMPRFSANRDPKTAQSLFWNATWFCLVISLLFFLPLAVLLPDFLRLWISPEFARQSAAVGQLVVLSYIAHAAYAPAATFFRGAGQIWLVTVVTFFAGVATLVFCVILIPGCGLIGVGYAYLLASVPSLLGLLHAWFYVFGRSSLPGLVRLIGLPLIMAGAALAIEYAIRDHFFGQLTWFGLFLLGGLFTALTGSLVVGADWVLGGADAPSKQFLRKVRESNRLVLIFRKLSLRRVC
jgi:O-antigen/teichoic acid export membrane protein